MRLVLVLLAVLVLVGGQGSGDRWLDLEDDYDEWSDAEEDGSGDRADMFDPREEEAENVIRLAEANIPRREEFDLIDMDYPEAEYEDEAEYAYDTYDESVLRIEDVTTNDIEIRPKLDAEEAEEVLLATSQIFIMVGSACVSFAIFVLSFFLCRRMVARKQQKQKKKSIPFIVVPDRKIVKESSIVKDYQKVPTSTKQILQNSDMYSGEPANENPSSVPLVP